MDVFISWSGNLSKKIGEALVELIQTVLQPLHPYFSPNDIEKGTKWHNEISKKLESCSFGLICLTEENTHSDWIQFEAGALSKQLDVSRICSILFNVSNSDISGPLKPFQTTKFDKEDILVLFKQMNNHLKENKISDQTVDKLFSMCYPEFEERVNIAIAESKTSISTTTKNYNINDVLDELLELTRSISRRISPIEIFRHDFSPYICKYSNTLNDDIIPISERLNEKTFSLFRKRYPKEADALIAIFSNSNDKHEEIVEDNKDNE